MALPQFSAEASIYRSTRHYGQVVGRAPVAGLVQPGLAYSYGVGPEVPCPYPCGYKPIYTIYGLRYRCDCPSWSDSGAVCPPGQAWCGGPVSAGGRCVNLSSDNNHCGSCDNVCPVGSFCYFGRCAPAFPG